MARRSKARTAGVAVLAAVTVLFGVVTAVPAGAAPIVVGDLSLGLVSQTTVGVGKANQSAGTLRILNSTPASTLTAGDQILLTLDDNGGTTCLPGDTLQLASVPTVTVTGTATMVASLGSSDAPLGLCALGSVEEQLRLNVTGSGTLTSIEISGVVYNVGAGTSTGVASVAGTLNGGAFGVSVGNAFVTTALLAGNNPPTGAAEAAGGSYVISPLVITEQTASGADNDLCIYFEDGIESTPAPAPTVAVTGGSDTATLTTDATNDFIFVDVTPSGPATSSTFTISGLRMETEVRRVQVAALYADNNNICNDGDGDRLSSADTTVGFVGDVNRFGGADRFATAQILFENEFVCPNDVIIARADQFPDALAASYLAGDLGTGILLTNTNSVPAATLNALRNEGVNNVFLMGGTAAISAAVATQLDGTTAYTCGGGPEVPAATLTVQRLAGVDRFETAQLAAELPGLAGAGTLDITPDDGIANSARTVVLASGLNFPDALAAGPLAYAGDCCDDPVPLLLTRGTDVPASTMAALTNLGIVNVVVVGGTAAVSDAAVAQLTGAGYHVRRIAGTSRQATAATLALAMISDWGYSDSSTGLARGDNFPDSLTGSGWAGHNRQVILLTSSATSLSGETATFLALWENVLQDEVDVFDVFGGTAAVSAAVVQAALDAASLQHLPPV
jgi:putative cell wall-binding protein